MFSPTTDGVEHVDEEMAALIHQYATLLQDAYGIEPYGEEHERYATLYAPPDTRNPPTRLVWRGVPVIDYGQRALVLSHILQFFIGGITDNQNHKHPSYTPPIPGHLLNELQEGLKNSGKRTIVIVTTLQLKNIKRLIARATRMWELELDEEDGTRRDQRLFYWRLSEGCFDNLLVLNRP